MRLAIRSDSCGRHGSRPRWGCPVIRPRSPFPRWYTRRFRWVFRVLIVIALGVCSMYSDPASAANNTFCAAANNTYTTVATCKATIGNLRGQQYGPTTVMRWSDGTEYDVATETGRIHYGFTRTDTMAEFHSDTIRSIECKSPRVWRESTHACEVPPDCPSPQVFDAANWTCGPPPQCQFGYTLEGGQCVPLPCPEAGTVDGTIRSGTPQHNCLQTGNGAICATEVSIGTIVGASGAITSHEVTYTGEHCEDDDVDLSNPAEVIDTPVGPFTPDNSQANGNGGCGYLNGVYKCLTVPAGDGACVRLESGGGYCVSTTTNTDTDDTPPDNGTEGQAATPGLSLSFVDGSGNTAATTGFYTGTQFQNSTNHGDGGDDDEPDCEANPNASGCPGDDDDGDGDGDGDEGDGTMPEVGDMYEQRYPNGIAGVWAEKWPQLKNTAFVQGVQSMFPTFAGGGSCPSWTVDLNFASGMNLGSHNVQVACWIWTVCGLILLTTACFAAWRIIF